MQLNLRAQALAFSVGLGVVMTTGLSDASSVPLNLSISKASTGFLKVSGSQIQDAQGKAISLRGVNIHTYYYQYQWDKTAPLKNATEADIKYLKSLGVNSIRLGLHWQYFQSGLGYQLIDNYVKWCENAGIYLILDMHVVPPETAVGQGKIWNNTVAKQKFVNLWKAIATRYADKKIIAGYDLFNEPSPADAQKWWNLADSAISTIRTVDKNHMFFIEPASTKESSFQLVNDTNVVYSFHDYQPYLISYAGYAGASDSPVPTDYNYPGVVLKDVYISNWGKGFNVIKPLTNWEHLESHELTVPANVEFAVLSIAAVRNVGNVWIDDITVTQNGSSFNVVNGSMEKASINNNQQPANWVFAGNGDFSGSWDNTVNRPDDVSGGHSSLKITGSNGGGTWSQTNQFYTAPLIKVKEGDKLSLQAWFYAPELKNAEFGLSLAYLNGNYELYTKDQLTTDIQPYVTWARNNNVPLYVGEFGALSTAKGSSRYNLVRDKISVMNEAGLSWSLWAYRDLGKPYFGLYSDQQLDKRLAGILKNGLQ